MNYEQEEVNEFCQMDEFQEASELGMVRFDIYEVISDMYDGSIDPIEPNSYELYYGEFPDEKFKKKYPKYMEEESENAIVVDVIVPSTAPYAPYFYFLTKAQLRSKKTIKINKIFNCIKDLQDYVIDSYATWSKGSKDTKECMMMAAMTRYYKTKALRYRLYGKMMSDELRKRAKRSNGKPSAT